MTINSINPANGEILKSFQALTGQEVQRKIEKAAQTFQPYRNTSFEQRRKWMQKAAEILETEKDQFGKLMTLEMGKPIQAGIDEAAKCAWACRYYVENAEHFLTDENVATNATRSFVAFQPLGVILAVMPWNFPFWQVFRFAAPALMAGNVGLLKHASNVPQCALAIEEIFRRAGFPEGAFQTLLIGSELVPQLIDHPAVKAVTLTGSEAAGVSVAGQAGKALKKTVLELGGSDPFIIMPSADMDQAVKTAVTARVINNGQSCIAAKRFIVHADIADEFEQRFVSGMQALKLGDPLDPSTQVGPLATEQIRRDLDQQVHDSIKAGARLLTGGKPLAGKGYFYQPTILTDIPEQAPAYYEETFGPVASLFRAPDIESAIRIANATSFGLGSSAWTNDPGECERFIRDLESGMVFINGMVASDPRLPFGGVKHSGYGRELSEFGIREFVNIKSVWIKEGEGHNRSATE